MLERLSDRTALVLELARAEVGRLGHHHIGTEHLLLGLLAEGDGAAARTLVAAGATLDGARDKVIEAVGRDVGGVRGEEPQYTARASRALERASRLSLQRRDEYLEPEHVLLSVLDVEGTAGQVLRVLGVDVVALRHAADLDVGEVSSDRPAPLGAERGRPGPTAGLAGPAGGPAGRAAGLAVGPAGPAGPTAAVDQPRCPDCRTSLEGGLAYRVLAAESGSASRSVVVVYCTACGSALGATPE